LPAAIGVDEFSARPGHLYAGGPEGALVEEQRGSVVTSLSADTTYSANDATPGKSSTQQ